MNSFSNTALSGRTYLVTGASSGIGLATAQLMSACGANLILSGRDQTRLEHALSSLTASGEHSSSVHTLIDADTTADWVKKLVEQHGPLNGVFHCAGAELIRPIRLTKQEQLNEIFASSVYAAFGIAKAAGQKNVLTDGGSLVFMSSVAGSNGQSGMTAYSAAKASIDGLVRSLSCELAPRGIRANSIAAGAVKTSMHERITKSSSEAAVQAYDNAHLLGFGEASDIANAAVFLLCDGSRWITGTTVFVDGGYAVR